MRSHNDAGLIRDTLTRLCAQTVADRMEILLFDDNSTDGTLEIASSFPAVTIVPWDGLPYNPPHKPLKCRRTAAKPSPLPCPASSLKSS